MSRESETPPADAAPYELPSKRRPRRVVVGALVGAAVLVVASGVTVAAMALVPAAQARTAAPAPLIAVNTAGFPSGGANPGIFTDTCKRTVTAPNDPILMPGMTGMSMQHDFFGNVGPTSSSLPSMLVGGSTMCSTAADASAYWTPVLYQNGTALTPSSTLIYWRAPRATASAVKSMPAGITMIAGNEAAIAPQDPRKIGWTCSLGKTDSSTAADIRLASTPTDCPSGRYLRFVATFPNCWDGSTLNGAKQSNVVYADDKTGCPASHPIQIPQVVMHVNYPTSSAAALTLSIGPAQQGSILTGHADFMDGWNQQVMNSDVAACIDTQTRCGPVSGPQGVPRGGVAG